MTKGHLTKAQTNQVGVALIRAGIPLEDCQWETRRRELIGSSPRRFGPSEPRIVHKPSKYFFEFRWSEAHQLHTYRSSPGPEGKEYVHKLPAVWNEVLEAVYRWGERLRAEIEAEDIWEQLGEDAANGPLPEPEDTTWDNQPFTSSEQELLRTRIEEIIGQLEAAGIRDEDAQRITRKEFEALREQVSRLDRGVWVKFALGTVVRLLLASVIGAEAARSLDRWLNTAIDAARRLLESGTEGD